jgi:hypothetical protein
MAPILSFLISSWSKKKEPRCVCLSEAKASRSHKMRNEVSSSVPHFLQVGLLIIPIICLLKVLCPVSRPITTLDFVLLKDNNQALVAMLGPESSSQACLCVLQGPRHNTRCRFSIQHFIFLYSASRLQRKAHVQQTLIRTISCELVGVHVLAIQHAQGPNTAPQCAG